MTWNEHTIRNSFTSRHYKVTDVLHRSLQILYIIYIILYYLLYTITIANVVLIFTQTEQNMTSVF